MNNKPREFNVRAAKLYAMEVCNNNPSLKFDCASIVNGARWQFNEDQLKLHVMKSENDRNISILIGQSEEIAELKKVIELWTQHNSTLQAKLVEEREAEILALEKTYAMNRSVIDKLQTKIQILVESLELIKEHKPLYGDTGVAEVARQALALYRKNINEENK